MDNWAVRLPPLPSSFLPLLLHQRLTRITATSENTSTPSTQSTDPVSKERGEKTAENIRYGQAISEQGVGGFTAPEMNSGSATQEGGSRQQEEDTGSMRREQGYGGDAEMSKTVGG